MDAALVVLLVVAALMAALGWASAFQVEKRAVRAEKELAARFDENEALRKAVADLLKTRRSATRERFLGLIEEQRAG